MQAQGAETTPLVRGKRFALVAGLAVLASSLAGSAVGPSTITILRDRYGVPHISASDDLKGAFADGYAMAEDRLFQMDILRRAGKGRLAELIGDDEALGASAIEFDISIRRELYTEPERMDMFTELEKTDPSSAAQFRAFVDGVNLRIAQDLADPIHKLPAEFVALGSLPQPWSITDSIAFAAVGLSIFGAEGGHEVENACLLENLTRRLGDEAKAKGVFNDLFWIDDPDAPTTIRDGVAVWPNVVGRFNAGQMALLDDPKIGPAMCKAATAMRAEQSAVDFIAGRLGLAGMFGAGHSNALVVSGSHTTTGHPMLGGGPQVGYSNPSFFWESGLRSPNYDSVGVNVPLGPGNIMGHTSTLAYTVTSGIDDQIDTYVERLNPANPRQYGSPGHWRDMDCRIETFLVRENPTSPRTDPGIDPNDPTHPHPPVRAVLQDLCRTIHGPVFYIDAADGVAFSHKKAHWMQDLKGAAAWLKLGRQTTLAGVEQDLDAFPFTFNFNYASTAGHIAYFHRGLTPLRPNDSDPRLPLPGTGYEWRTGPDGKQYVANSAILTTDGRPAATVIDPASGFFANWNNKPIKGWGGAGEARELWGPRHRTEGLSNEVDRLIAAGTPIALDEQGADPTTTPACFTHDDYVIGTDPLGCVSSVNGIVRKAATSDFHIPTVLPFLSKAIALEGVSTSSPEYQAFLNMKQWSDAGGPLLRTGTGATYRFPGVAIYDDWRNRLQHTLLDDELGAANHGMDYPAVIEGDNEDDHGSYLTPDSVLYHVLTHAPELAGVEPATTLAPSLDYCDTGTTHQTCAALLVATLQQSVAALTSRFGSADQSKWRENVVVSTIPAQGAAPEITIERMNRGSFNQLHDFGPGAAFRTFNVVPPGESGMIDLLTLAKSQVASDPVAAVNAGNPHVFDQAPLYQGWRYKPFVLDEHTLVAPTSESIPYVRGVVPDPDPTLLRTIYRLLESLGIRLPNIDLFGEISSE